MDAHAFLVQRKHILVPLQLNMDADVGNLLHESGQPAESLGMEVHLQHVDLVSGFQGRDELIDPGDGLFGLVWEEQREVVDIVEFVELFVELQRGPDDGGHAGELVEQLKLLGVEFEPLNDHLLGEHHQDHVLEPPADDHVPDCGGHKLLQEPLLRLLVDEVPVEILPLVGELNPCVGLEHLSHVLQLVVGGDLIELFELGLEHLLIERRLLELGQDRGWLPCWDQRNILHR